MEDNMELATRRVLDVVSERMIERRPARDDCFSGIYRASPSAWTLLTKRWRSMSSKTCLEVWRRLPVCSTR